MALSLAKETEDASAAGNNGAYFDRRDRGNKCSDGVLPTAKGRVHSTKLICHRDG